MATAVEQVQKQELSLREASRMYNVPLETRRRRVNGTVSLGCGPKTALTEEEETRLATYLIEMSDMGYGLTCEGVMGLAYSIVEKTTPYPERKCRKGLVGRFHETKPQTYDKVSSVIILLLSSLR